MYRPYVATILLFVSLYIVLEIFPGAFPYLHRTDYRLRGKMAMSPLQAGLFTYRLVRFRLADNVWQLLASP